MGSDMNLVQHIMRRGLLKEEAIAHSRAAQIAARQPLNKMARLKPLLKQREEWLARQAN